MTSQASRVSALLPGGDPAPGDVEDVRLVVARLRRAVQSADDVREVLRAVGSAGAGIWAGPAADTFAAHHQDLTARLDTAHTAYTQAADVLQRWMGELELAQQRASALVARAHAVAQAAAYPPGPVPAELIALRHQHAALAAEAHADAQRCARALQVAIDDVAHFTHSFWQNFDEDLVKASKFMHEVGDVLGVVALVVGLCVPGVGELLFVGVMALSVAELGVDAYLTVKGKQPWSEVTMDGIGVALGAGGKLAQTALKGAREATILERAARSASGRAGGYATAAARAEQAGWTGQAAVYDAGMQAAKEDATAFRAGLTNSPPTAGGGLVRTTLSDVEHPFLSVRESQIVARAKQYAPLPALRTWQRVLPHHPVATTVSLASHAWDVPSDLRGGQTLLDIAHHQAQRP